MNLDLSRIVARLRSSGVAVALCASALCATLPVVAGEAAPAALSRPSRPPPARVWLDYGRAPAASSCVSAEQLARDVEARLGRRVFVEAAQADLVARVEARRAQGRFIVDVELRDPGGRRLGQRQLSTGAAHCSSLDDSLALVLALAADAPGETPEQPAAALPDGPSPPSAPAPPPPASLETPLAIPPSTPAPRGWRWAASAGAALASGPFPAAAFGVELGVELRPPLFWPVSLRGTWWVEQGVGGPRAGRRVHFAARTLELGVCPWTGVLGSFEAAACAVQWLGRSDARGSGFDENGVDEGWVAAAGLSPALAHRFGPLSVSAAGSLLVPLVRRRYFSRDAADITLHQQPALFVAGTLRVAAEF